MDEMGSRIRLNNRNGARNSVEQDRRPSITSHDTPQMSLIHRPNDQGNDRIVQIARRLGYPNWDILGKCDAPCKRPYLEWIGGGAILRSIARQAARFTFTRTRSVGRSDAPPQ